MQLRRFNADGLAEFERQIDALRGELPEGETPRTGSIDDLLEAPAFTEPVGDLIVPDHTTFTTRREAAEFLMDLIGSLPAEGIEKDAGLWSWLSARFFKELMFTGGSEKRSQPLVTMYYRFEAEDTRNWSKHHLFTAWRLLSVAPEHNHLLLNRPVGRNDKFTDLVLGNLGLSRIPAIYEVLERLYWLPEKGMPRPRITGPDTFPGDFQHRFIARLNQLEKTYDLMVVSADQLIELLGPEFSTFDSQRAPELELV